MPSSPTRLLMVGAGHAALEALRRLGRTPLSGVELTLVSLGTRHHYSGMVPGYLAGMYEEEDLAFELPVLVERGPARQDGGASIPGLDRPGARGTGGLP
jgi:selenide,water dikinase